MRACTYMTLLAVASLCQAGASDCSVLPVHNAAPVYADETGDPNAPKPIAGDQGDPSWGIRSGANREYGETVRRVTSMVSDGDLQQRVARRGLGLMNVTWEIRAGSRARPLGPTSPTSPYRCAGALIAASNRTCFQSSAIRTLVIARVTFPPIASLCGSATSAPAARPRVWKAFR